VGLTPAGGASGLAVLVVVAAEEVRDSAEMLRLCLDGRRPWCLHRTVSGMLARFGSVVNGGRRGVIRRQHNLRALLALAAIAGGSMPSLAGAADASAMSPGKLPTPSSCAEHVVDGVIPSWARAGFSEPKPVMHYELASHGDVVALLWAYPLLSPPPTTHNNKILWVSRVATNGSPLLISAHRMVGSEAVGPAVQRQVAGGPGPSIINLPLAGCWHLDLRWSGHSDTMDLDYVVNRGA